MGALNQRLGLTRFVPFHRQILDQSDRPERYSWAEHVRLGLEELGTTGIKLGQILSTRPDLLPPDLITELEKLRDRVPAVPTDVIIRTIESEFGCSVAEVFSEFEDVPLAGASIGQVHGATLLDGTRVVVKVRKPGIEETVSTDLAIVADLAARAARAELLGRNYDVVAVADDFAWTLRAEMDYVREGRNADRLRQAFADDPRVLIPAVHWSHTTQAVLVMERIDGIRIADVEAIEAAGHSRRALARTSAEILMKQVFEDGFFHADPHPGNFMVTSEGRLALLDFGMVGELEEAIHHRLLQVLVAVVSQDAEAVTNAIEALGVIRTPVVRESVRRDVRHVLGRYYGLSASQFDLREYINDTLTIVRRHGLQLPTELALVLKTVGMSEGLWRSLDPAFNSAQTAERFVARAAQEMYSPRSWGSRLLRTGSDTLELSSNLPGQLGRLVSRLDRGEFEIVLQHRELDETLNRLSSMVTRLSLAIVTSAFIVGLPFLSLTYEPPGWKYIAPAWFFGGVLIVIGLIARLAIAGRHRREA
jgi:ubiquinone biosynthesis protein